MTKPKPNPNPKSPVSGMQQAEQPDPTTGPHEVEASGLLPVPSAPRGIGDRVRHLRVEFGVAAVLAVLGAIVSAAFGGGLDGAVGFVAGVALVAASYTASTLAIAWADSINPRMVFPVGMAMYLTKFTLLGAFLISVGATEWVGKIPMAIGILVGVVGWTATQIWWTVKTTHPYVGHAGAWTAPPRPDQP
jgi:hypothetical protein